MSTRLTKDIREAISVAVLKHRFESPVKALAEDVAAFATTVYEDVYKKADRAAMGALPAGWLYEATDINIRFGSSFENLRFSGRGHGELSKFDYRPTSISITRRVIEKHRRSCLKDYEATHKLAIRFSEIDGRSEDLKKQISETRRQVDAALSAVGTVKRLIETWPEIAPFAQKYETEKPQLPALPTVALNAILDLPVSEAA